MNIEKLVKIAKVVKIIPFLLGPVIFLISLIAIAMGTTNEIWANVLFISIAIIFFSVAFKDLLKLDHFIKLKHPEIYYGGPVYKVNLWSVSEDMIFTYKMDRFAYNARFKLVDYCLVQKTYNPDYVREIISGTLIPVSEIYRNNVIDSINPVCVLINHGYALPHSGKLTFRECTLDEVKHYIKERSDGYKGFETFNKYLEDIFSKGKEIYLNKEKEYNEIQELVKK